MRTVILISLIFLAGCATTDWNSLWYGNPAGSTYNYGCHCESCNRIFTVSVISQQISQSQTVTCPYCGHIQNLQYALNRYSYYAANAQQQPPDLLSAFGEALRSGTETQTRYQQQVIDSVLNKRNERTRTHCYKVGNDIYCDTK